jgi:hypothetical protein
MPMTNDELASAVQDLIGAMGSGNTAKAQEAIREFNLTYTNQTAEQYGQNFGVGQPAPANVPNLAAQQAQGGIGYIPGVSGFNADQSLAAQNQYASIAAAQAGLTGTYTAPVQSQYSPGSWVMLPASLSGGNGDQYAMVTPSGQIQRLGLTEATARGYKPGMATPIGYQEFMQLASAPPTGMPQQTLQGLTGYSNLNTAAQNSAIAQSGVTGMYQAPTPVLQPGFANDGSSFYQQDQGTQQAYMQRFNGDANMALNAWTNATNTAINQSRAAQGLPPLTAYGYAGNPGAQETLAAQNQYFTQANDLATQYGQYYAPGAPGQAGVAGVNTPIAGQTTLAGQNQAYTQQMGVINAAAGLQANPFRQAQVLGQAGRVLQGMPTAGFSAPNTVTGVGTAGGNTQGGMGYLQQMIDDIRDPTANQTTAQSWLNNTPTPNKLDSQSFLASSPTTQNLILQSMQEKYGIDPTDSMAQIKATLPSFAAPQTFGTVKRG